MAVATVAWRGDAAGGILEAIDQTLLPGEMRLLKLETSQAVWEARNKISEIENTPFNQVEITYDGVTFVSNALNGTGVTYVDDTQPDMLAVTVTFCWREKNGRIIGEDTDLNGQIDVGEDLNANGMIDSIATMRTLLYDS